MTEPLPNPKPHLDPYLHPVGIDLAHWQGYVNYDRMMQAHISFLFIKATESTAWVDPRFEENWRNSTDKIALRSPYHYYEASADPYRQAGHFYSHVMWDTVTMPPMDDIEDTTGIPYSLLPNIVKSNLYKLSLLWVKRHPVQPDDWYSYWVTTNPITNDEYRLWPERPARSLMTVGQTILAYSNRVKTNLVEIERLTGMRPIIYTAKSYWDTYVGANGYDWADTYPLFIANYRQEAGPLVPAPWSPHNWLFWQWMSKGKGPKYGTTSLNVDLDVFNGSHLDLLAINI